ncbi:MAG: dTDP-4-dehydrorhamnose 3,5-epimerase [Myxococcota bacterium]
MKVEALAIEDVRLISPRVFGDARGFFFESFHAARYADVGIVGPFVQDNVSRSERGVLRGLHLQHPKGQGKLVQVLEGAVYDVAVDVRTSSPTFGKWVGARLDAETHQQLWVPPGFAHGFLVLSDFALFAYKCTDVYAPEHELSVRWNDPAIGIEWPTDTAPKLSEKDRAAPTLAAAKARLPR